MDPKDYWAQNFLEPPESSNPIQTDAAATKWAPLSPGAYGCSVPQRALFPAAIHRPTWTHMPLIAPRGFPEPGPAPCLTPTNPPVFSRPKHPPDFQSMTIQLLSPPEVPQEYRQPLPIPQQPAPQPAGPFQNPSARHPSQEVLLFPKPHLPLLISPICPSAPHFSQLFPLWLTHDIIPSE